MMNDATGTLLTKIIILSEGGNTYKKPNPYPKHIEKMIIPALEAMGYFLIMLFIEYKSFIYLYLNTNILAQKKQSMDNTYKSIK